MSLIAVTGASGFVGRAVVSELRRRGHAVVELGRTRGSAANTEWRQFDPSAGRPNPAAFEGANAVIHLAGETVSGRWDARKKHAILESREAGTRAVVESLAALDTKPRVLVTASATGFYGSRGDEPLHEGSAAGADFLAHVCVAWEREAQRAEAYGIRSVQIRTGIALGRNGGALAAMSKPFKYGVGGPFGNGKQFMPWIHVDDLARIYADAVDNERYSGPINAVTPDYATCARFTQALGAALHRPALAPAPGFALHAVLGEFAQTLLGSQLVLPAVLLDAGFSWNHPILERALSEIYDGYDDSRLLRTFSIQEHIPKAQSDVFAFFADARNLEAITPPHLHFSITSLPERLERGAIIEYRLNLHGVPMRWKTMIARWNPPHDFEDVQLHGPYALWRHEHSFEPAADGTRVRDAVTYALPLHPLSSVAERFVASDVNSIFTYRRNALVAAFA